MFTLSELVIAYTMSVIYIDWIVCIGSIIHIFHITFTVYIIYIIYITYTISSISLTLLITVISCLFSMQLFEVFVLFTVSTSFIVLIWLRFFIYDICKMCIHTDVYIYICTWKIAVMKPVCILLHRQFKPSWSQPICDRARRYSNPLAPKAKEMSTKVTFLFGKHESNNLIIYTRVKVDGTGTMYWRI